MIGKISAAILAGGANKRFNGKIKANITVEGKKIITRIYDTLKDVFEEIIIVTNVPGEFIEFSDCLIVPDHYAKIGPLGGIHAALKASSGESVFIFACDMPFPDKELIISQIEYFEKMKWDILIPAINDNIEPLHAIFSTRIMSDIENYIAGESDYSVRAFTGKENTGYFQLDDSERIRRAFRNINSSVDISLIESAGAAY